MAETFVLDYIQNIKHVSFAELEKRMEEENLVIKTEGWEEGQRTFLCQSVKEEFKNLSLVTWVSSNKLLIDTIIKLEEQGKIVQILSDFFIYLVDGHVLRFPLLDKRIFKRYEKNPEKFKGKEFWVPVIFNTPENVTPKQKRLMLPRIRS
jgi:hypothetical protein